MVRNIIKIIYNEKFTAENQVNQFSLSVGTKIKFLKLMNEIYRLQSNKKFEIHNKFILNVPAQSRLFDLSINYYQRHQLDL